MKILTISIIIVSLSFYCSGQNSFELDISSEDDEIVWESTIDAGGNALLVGLIGNYLEGEYDALILKVFSNGNYISKRFKKQDTIGVFSTIELIESGNYLVMGSYSPEGDQWQKNYLWICLLDENLNLLNEKSFKINESYVGFGTNAKSIVDNSGNIVITAMALEEQKEGKTIFSAFAFYKLTQEGDTLFSKYYNYLWDERPFELRQMPNSDNLMLIDCAVNMYNHNELLFLDKDLNILFYNMFGSDYLGMSGRNCSSEHWCTDTSFLMSTDNSWNSKNQKSEDYIAVYLVDTSANIHEELALNKPDTADYAAWRNSMAYANDSTIYIGGFQSLVSLWSTNPTVVELYMIDKNMNLLGYKELGGDANYEVWGILATEDDGCLVYATCYDNPFGVLERDVHIWKVLRDEINLLTSIESFDIDPSINKVWPNPVKNDLYIGLNQSNSQNEIQIQIFNTSGKKMIDQKLSGIGNVIKINVTNLKSGSYLFKIIDKEGKVVSGKFIKQ